MKKLRITIEGKTYEVEVEILGSRVASVAPVAAPAPVAAAPVVAAPVAAPAAPKAAPKAAPAAAAAGDVVCPLAATVKNVAVKEGQAVKAGDLLVMLEAMKMDTPVNAVADGVVSKIYVAAGQSVQEGEPLIGM
ncbi:MAG: biotin/lipoyl-binding protein [Opitutales bacterium]|nr:biotin/lipoyl-binding protein [Opitutales bacterium]